ncbi:toxin-antitoxin system HicB family antitoxin [Microbacterium luticocti]|uniref:toxin-antitoxin system HicB family antitoxin n=1 Tax=Microbacterium luticocti TaxID=451764 RepID=UPI0003F94874|nr:toxin-antitoxin system HicB family antitoxin [Microbacterium luticocti]
MQITTHVEDLQRQLLAAAAAGTPEAAEIAEHLVTALDASARLVLLEALSDAAGEITRELAPGSVDVRLRGRDVDFVVSLPAAEHANAEPAATAPAVASDDDADAASTRTTLRLPEALKTRAETAAAAEGLSLNTWLVRAVTAALEPRRPAAGGGTANAYTGWVR